jgi:hypothetical protein
MAKVKRSQKIGLRPSPLSFSSKKITKAQEEVDRIIKGDIINDKEKFLRRYFLEVCRFRIAQENKTEGSLIYKKIKKLQDQAIDSFGFTKEYLISLNVVFRDKTKSEIEFIYNILKK